MHKILPAVALFIALSSPAAEAPAAGAGPVATPQPGLIHTALAVPQGPATPAPAVAPAGLKAAEDPAKPAREGERTAGMLLAGLALIAGIVLRRWGAEPR